MSTTEFWYTGVSVWPREVDGALTWTAKIDLLEGPQSPEGDVLNDVSTELSSHWSPRRAGDHPSTGFEDVIANIRRDADRLGLHFVSPDRPGGALAVFLDGREWDEFSSDAQIVKWLRHGAREVANANGWFIG